MTSRSRTWILLAGLSALFVAVGGLVGGTGGIVVFLAIAIVFNFAMFWFSDRIALKMSRARPLEAGQMPDLVADVEDLSARARIPVPRLYVIPSQQPNAFATGRNPQHSAVAVTEGLVALMPRDQVRGVLAHELSHIRNRDVRLMSLVAVLVGVVALLSDFLFRISFFGGGRKSGGTAGLIAFALGLAALALAPIAAVLIQLAVSRRREYLADASGAEITGDGEGLALALRKLQLDTRETRHAGRAIAHLYIENPLNQASGMAGAMRSLFDTHPPLEARIARLEEAGGFKLPPV
jgi:heat shock protein HtpX